MSVRKADGTPNLLVRSRQFLSESFAELTKVSMPTRAEATQATLVTVFIILFLSVCLFLLDIIFNQIMQALLA
jgi:preprotein translocase SecE subunit